MPKAFVVMADVGDPYHTDWECQAVFFDWESAERYMSIFKYRQKIVGVPIAPQPLGDQEDETDARS